MTAILALALLCQIPVEDNPDRWEEPKAPSYDPRLEIRLDRTQAPAVDGERDNLEFQAAVEESVAGMSPKATPEHIRDMVARTGVKGWKERDAASKALEAHCRANPADARWLFVERRNRDPEIAHRTNGVLGRLNPCGGCKGTGLANREWEWTCGRCNGHGREWMLGAWD